MVGSRAIVYRPRMNRAAIVVAANLLAAALVVAPVRAEVVAGEVTEELGVAEALARDAAFTPNLLRAHDGTAAGFVVASTAWSGPSDRVQLDALGEVRVYKQLRLIVRVADAFRDTAKPGIGAGYQFLDEARHGVSSTAYLQFKTEGFTEPEGELEAVLAFGRRFGAVRALLDVAYGQDPEGNERDGELALAAQVQARRGLHAGVTGRYRDALGSTKEAIARDAFGGAAATFAAGRFAVTGMLGVAMVQLHDADAEVGAAATLAIGAGF